MRGMKARGTCAAGASLAAIAAAGLLVASPAWAASGRGGPDKPRPAKAGAARPGPLVRGTGIAQAVRSHVVLVRQLDGRAFRVRVGPRTTVLVDGARASLDQIKPGFVVSFAMRVGRAATEVRARSIASSGPAAKAATTVQSVSADAVVVTRPNGSTSTIPVGARTRVVLDGSPVSVADIKAGDVLVQAAGAGKGGKPARVLRLRRPG
jgi:hypothetical protein